MLTVKAACWTVKAVALVVRARAVMRRNMVSLDEKRKLKMMNGKCGDTIVREKDMYIRSLLVAELVYLTLCAYLVVQQ
jgi:hypothetical protein